MNFDALKQNHLLASFSQSGKDGKKEFPLKNKTNKVLHDRSMKKLGFKKDLEKEIDDFKDILYPQNFQENNSLEIGLKTSKKHGNKESEKVFIENQNLKKADLTVLGNALEKQAAEKINEKRLINQKEGGILFKKVPSKDAVGDQKLKTASPFLKQESNSWKTQISPVTYQKLHASLNIKGEHPNETQSTSMAGSLNDKLPISEDIYLNNENQNSFPTLDKTKHVLSKKDAIGMQKKNHSLWNQKTESKGRKNKDSSFSVGNSHHLHHPSRDFHDPLSSMNEISLKAFHGKGKHSLEKGLLSSHSLEKSFPQMKAFDASLLESHKHIQRGPKGEMLLRSDQVYALKPSVEHVEVSKQNVPSVLTQDWLSMHPEISNKKDSYLYASAGLSKEASKSSKNTTISQPVHFHQKVFHPSSLKFKKKNFSKSSILNQTFPHERQTFIQKETTPALEDLKGFVAKGSLGKSILARETSLRVAQAIEKLAQSSQKRGHIRIRLHPKELGELFVKVSIEGSQVKLAFQTQSVEAKKVIEESLSKLKDQLLTRHLNVNQAQVHVLSQEQPSMSLSHSFGDLSGGTGQESVGAWGFSKGDSQKWEMEPEGKRSWSTKKASRASGILQNPKRVFPSRGIQGGRLNVEA